MLNVLIGVVIAAVAFLLGMIFNAPVSREKTFDEEKFMLENAKARGFCFRMDPVISHTITDGPFIKYLNYLRAVVEALNDDELNDLVRGFWQQERQMQYLYVKIVKLLFKMNLDKMDYPYPTLQKVFDEYSNNRLEVCKAIKIYVEAEDLGLKEQYMLVLSDLKFDNDNLLRPIMSFYLLLSGYLESIKVDDDSSDDSETMDEPETQGMVIRSLTSDFASDIRIVLMDTEERSVLNNYLETWRRVYDVV
jgi:hypothetical protein